MFIQSEIRLYRVFPQRYTYTAFSATLPLPYSLDPNLFNLTAAIIRFITLLQSNTNQN